MARGTIRQRSKLRQDSWNVQVYLGKDQATGRKRYRSETVKGTFNDAQRRLTEMLSEVDRGVLLERPRMTVGEYLRSWLEDQAAARVRPRTLEGYRGLVRLYLEPALGRIQLDRLTSREVQSLQAELLRSGGSKGSGLSPRTVLHAHRVLCNALEGAVRLGLVPRNVARSVSPPRVTPNEMRSLTWEELARFLSLVRNQRHKSIFLMAAQTGLRRSELLGLRWNDVDFEARTLSVRRALVRLSSGECDLSPPKSGRGRSLDLFPETIELLRELQNCHSGNGDFVYGKSDGSPLDPDVVTRAFGRTARAAGFDGLRFHDLRHTHASLLLKEGVHPKVVSERLGHASIEITLNLYSHVLPTVQRNAVDRFGEAWRAGFSSGPADEVPA